MILKIVIRVFKNIMLEASLFMSRNIKSISFVWGGKLVVLTQMSEAIYIYYLFILTQIAHMLPHFLYSP